ncbi:MAG: GIY-YIG nuclease family protein [Rhodopseudomonas palustris]|uniref:GIY-YIG nuclease family protein n=1 Tax=Rhodopseudomonas palustris TaxID=1076 RepID=A0A933S0I2_RHOPL|nr:GIY-YIG nuclease family protein [Rhodopseudomonas palustris]
MIQMAIPSISVEQLLDRAGLTLAGTVKWRTKVPESSSGIYVISIDCPEDVQLDGLPSEVRSRWNEGQQIIYIGRSVNVGKRLSQFYRHVRGKPRPHRGGEDILRLEGQKLVHWSCVREYALAERKLIEFFEQSVGKKPFGNRMRSAQLAKVSIGNSL